MEDPMQGRSVSHRCAELDPIRAAVRMLRLYEQASARIRADLIRTRASLACTYLQAYGHATLESTRVRMLVRGMQLYSAACEDRDRLDASHIEAHRLEQMDALLDKASLQLAIMRRTHGACGLDCPVGAARAS